MSIEDTKQVVPPTSPLRSGNFPGLVKRQLTLGLAHVIWGKSDLLGEDILKSEEDITDPPGLDNNTEEGPTQSTRKRRADDDDDDFDRTMEHEIEEVVDHSTLPDPVLNLQDSPSTTSLVEEENDNPKILEVKSEPDTTTTPIVVELPSSTPMEQDQSDDDSDHSEDNPPRSEAVLRFKVERASTLKLDEVRFSQFVVIRNLLWRILVIPKRFRAGDAIGIFIECALDEKYKRFKSWRCFSVTKVSLVSQREGVHYWKRLDYTFGAEGNDRGWSDFVMVNVLLDPERGFCNNDSFTIVAEIKADPPHYAGWPSKKYTGYVGLNNQGATCYMNSLLQSLYFTNQLRKAVYKMPTAFSDTKGNVPLALQRVFYKLQTSDKSISTLKFTKAFGFENLDSLTQQDVQEFFRILLDKLECTMKGTCVEGMVPKLFEGKMISYIKCKNVEYESSRSETFYDIQLNIQNKKDIYESFDDYVATEDLEGDNKYDAGTHGLQEAAKGVIFESFPPVLHLHLLRFQYDPVLGTSAKSNRRFEFYDHIKLDKYLKYPSSSTESESASYTLHAVLVHCGDESGGHYVVFINPRGDGNWCKFNDDVVSSCTHTEAVKYNFGGSESYGLFHPGVFESTNAYMLVYIRDSDLATVLQDVGESDLPPELLERFKDEEALCELKRKQGKQDYLYVQIEVLTEGAFMGHQGPQLYDHKRFNPAVRANLKIFEVLKTANPRELLQILAETYGVNEKRLRLWPFIERLNDTIRPEYMSMDPNDFDSLGDSKLGQTTPFFLEMLPADDENESLPPFDFKHDLLIFFKMYDPVSTMMHYCGHWTAPLKTSFSTLAEECRRRMDWANDESMEFYEEIVYNVKRIRALDRPLSSCFERMEDGNIVVFHKTVDPSKKNTSLAEYYDLFSNRTRFRWQ